LRAGARGGGGQRGRPAAARRRPARPAGRRRRTAGDGQARGGGGGQVLWLGVDRVTHGGGLRRGPGRAAVGRRPREGAPLGEGALPGGRRVVKIAFLVERPTQFEAPFFRFAARDTRHELRVLFTGTDPNGPDGPAF